MSYSTTLRLRRCLLRLGSDDSQVRSELLAYANRRLRLLSERMFRRCPQLNAHEQVDDLFQEAMIRLWKSLEVVGPTTVSGFMGLAALQMRRALSDLARCHFGRKEGHSVALASPLREDPVADPGRLTSVDDRTNAPDELACWTEFHSCVDRLPEPYRTAFDLLYYHEMPQNEVAELMNISVRQVQRYWHAARMKLTRMMDDTWPEL